MIGGSDREVHGGGPVAAQPAVVVSRLGWVPKVGIGAWTFIGFVTATAIVVAALAAVSEIVLPLTFAAVLAVVFSRWWQASSATR